jgi:hypothetical protein
MSAYCVWLAASWVTQVKLDAAFASPLPLYCGHAG